jgi:membrane fusion protein (multidrug efflux system)
MAEQDPASNPPKLTSPVGNAPTGDPSTAAAPIPAYPKRRSRKRLIVVASSVVLVVGGVFLWLYLPGFESTDDAQVDVHLYPVSARNSGYVQKVNVEDNQH